MQKKKHLIVILFQKDFFLSNSSILALLCREHYIYPAFKELIWQLHRSKGICELHTGQGKNHVCVWGGARVGLVVGARKGMYARARWSYAEMP